jgi:hypothetical protein
MRRAFEGSWNRTHLYRSMGSHARHGTAVVFLSSGVEFDWVAIDSGGFRHACARCVVLDNRLS